MTCISVSIKHAGHGHAVHPVDVYSNASCKLLVMRTLMCILMHIPFRIARNIPTEACIHTTPESLVQSDKNKEATLMMHAFAQGREEMQECNMPGTVILDIYFIKY